MDSIQQQNMLSQLLQTREILQENLNMAIALEVKLVGPRPTDPINKQQAPPANCIQTLIVEISSLSHQLNKMLNSHHNILGDVGVPIAGTAAPNRAYA